MAYHRYHGVNTHLVRIFNTYGPRLQANDGRVISNFMIQALSGEPLTIYGDGSQTRSFCFVSDLIDGIVRLSRSDEHMPVNIGNPDEWTILECAHEVLAVTGSKSEIVRMPLPQDDPTRRRPDITRAQTLLGWQPKIALREGLERSLEYFRASVALIGNIAVHSPTQLGIASQLRVPGQLKAADSVLSGIRSCRLGPSSPRIAPTPSSPHRGQSASRCWL